MGRSGKLAFLSGDASILADGEPVGPARIPNTSDIPALIVAMGVELLVLNGVFTGTGDGVFVGTGVGVFAEDCEDIINMGVWVGVGVGVGVWGTGVGSGVGGEILADSSVTSVSATKLPTPFGIREKERSSFISPKLVESFKIPPVSLSSTPSPVLLSAMPVADLLKLIYVPVPKMFSGME